MPTDFYTFGEILWDCLPAGRHAGGAPFNVAAHLAQLGGSVQLLSALGQDTLGDELLQIAHDRGVGAEFIGRSQGGLPTGTVQVTVDAQGNATYEIVQPVAWDEIAVPEEALAGVAGAQAFVFGSLAARSEHNRAALERLLAMPGPLRFFDVNLRPPFGDPALVVHLAQQADVLKLNDDEAGRLASWVRTGSWTMNPLETNDALAAACAILAEATHVTRICITRGARGAALWDQGVLLTAPAPAVTVLDTVGAGDAFMAGLVCGLTCGLAAPLVLSHACRLGAYVASQHGAIPVFPAELRALFHRDSILPPSRP